MDTGDLRQTEEALSRPTRLVLVETLSNPLLRAVDLSALAEMTRRRGAILVVDNTFATPVLTRPLELGADLVMESLTKMIGGHGDVTLGLVCGNIDLLNELSGVVSIWGLASNPFDCWLAERGLATLPLRMRTASANAAELAGRAVVTGMNDSGFAGVIVMSRSPPSSTIAFSDCSGDSAFPCQPSWSARKERTRQSSMWPWKSRRGAMTPGCWIPFSTAAKRCGQPP